jgi:hypothetical protein
MTFQYAVDAFWQCAYRENMARLAVRTISLIAAYALALHALVLTLTPPAALAGTAATTSVVICSGDGSSDQPAGKDQTPCAPDCAMACCGTGGWVPPSVDVVAKVTPTQLPRSLQFTHQPIIRVSYRSPQAPRAPPLA